MGIIVGGKLPDGFSYQLYQFDQNDNISDVLTRTLIRVKQINEDGSLLLQIAGYNYGLLQVKLQQLGLSSVAPDTTLVGFVTLQRKPEEIFFAQVELLPEPDEEVLGLFPE